MISQKGVSLVITFFIMTTALSVILSLGTILFSEMKILGNIGSSVSSLYSAESGIEQVLYFDRKLIPNGGTRGFCNICNVCTPEDCASCTATSLVGEDGCNPMSCTNCKVTYTSTFASRDYNIYATVIPNELNPNLYDLTISASGLYSNITRAIQTYSVSSPP